VALVNTQTDGKTFDKNAQLTNEQVAVCKALGLSEDEYKKSISA